MLRFKNSLLILINYFVGYIFIIPVIMEFIQSRFQIQSYDLMEFVLVALHLLITIYFARSLLINEQNKKLNFSKLAIFAVGLFLTTTLLNVLCNLIIFFINGDLITGENEVAVENLIISSPFLAIFLACIFAPISEELVFRAILFKNFKKIRVLAYFLGGVGFGLIHYTEIFSLGLNLINILHVLPYVFVGLLLCLVYDKTDNIYATILTHCLFNSISLCLTLTLI